MRRREKCLAQRSQRKCQPSSMSVAAADGSVQDHEDHSKLCSAFESKHITVKSHHMRGRYVEVWLLFMCIYNDPSYPSLL